MTRLLIGVAIALGGFTTYQAYADLLGDIADQVSIAEYQSYLRVLTGVDPAPGTNYHIPDRWSLGVQGIYVAGDYIYNHFASAGLEPSYHIFNWTYGPSVIGEIRGSTRPDDVYIICAHYDAVPGTPGCDDNGSGTAAVMTAARILGHYRCDATVRFIAFSGEEQWMVGSLDYAHGAYLSGENIVAAINLDMILHPGFDNAEPDPDYDLDIATDPGSSWLAEYLSQQYAQYTPIDYQVHVDADAVSDHWSFWQWGYNAVGVHENTVWEIWGGSNDTYHQPTDAMDNPDFDWEFGRHAIRGAVVALAGLAGAMPIGDLNCDGSVDFDDIDPFVLALTDPAGYPIQYPNCNIMNGDCNRDGLVGFDDIDPFVALLSALRP
jgi:hypothetical protein